MAEERAYTPQIGPARPTGLPQASPGDFGAGVGAGIAQLGGVLHESEVKAYRIERELQTNAQRTEFAKKFAQARLDLDVATEEARKAPGTDAAAFMKAAADRYDAATKDLTSGISDDAARGEAEGQLATYRAGYVAGERQYATVTIAKSTAGNRQAATDLGANRIEFGADDGAYPLEKLQADQEINDLDVAEPVKVVLRRDMDEKYGSAQIRRGLRTDPKAMVASIDRGDWNAVISPDELNRLRAMGEVEGRKLDIATEKAQAATVAADKEAEAMMLGDVGRGVAVDPRALADAAAKAEARGDTSRSAELRAAAVRSNTNRIYGAGNATPDQMSSRLAAIEGGKDWRSNPDLVAEHAQLLTLRDQQRTADPVLAPVDLNNPAAIEAQAQKQGAWARLHNGRMVFFGKDQAAELGALAASGPAGRSDVAGYLARLPAQWKNAALDQVARGDEALRAAMFLAPPLRAELFAGEAAARDNPKIAPKADMSGRWGEQAGRALNGLPPGAVSTLKKGIDLIYAARAAKGNLQEFDADLYDSVANEVLGANGRGAIGRWNGTPFVLPRGVSQPDMERRLYAMADTFGAYYADGKTPIPKSVLLDRYHPVSTARDGVYRWVDANGNYAFTRNRQPGEIDVRYLKVPQPVGFDPTKGNVYTQMGGAAGAAAPKYDPQSPYAKMGGGYRVSKPK